MHPWEGSQARECIKDQLCLCLQFGTGGKLLLKLYRGSED